MQKHIRLLERGFYRDLDGKLVRLLKVRSNLCIWVPLTPEKPARQVTHRDNFLRRFTPVLGKSAA